MLMVGATGAFTVIVTALLVAGQVDAGLTTQVTTSPLAKVPELKLRLEPVAATTPLTSHCNEGFDPAFEIVALKFTLVPAHTEVEEAAIDAVALGKTVIETLSTEAQPVLLAYAVLTKYFVVMGADVVLLAASVGSATVAELRLVEGVHV
jgi:hypothetical protein